MPDAGLVLSLLNFGKVDSESEQDLARRFLRTADFDKFLEPDTLLILGAKGSGKSAIFRLLTEFEQAARRLAAGRLDGIVPGPATGQADLREVSSADLEDIGKQPEFDYDKFWRVYVALKVASALGKNGFSSKGPLKEVLRGFGQVGDWRLLPLMKKFWQLVVGPHPKTFEVSIGELAVKMESGHEIDITALLSEEEDVLVEQNKTLWLLFDKIDELQSAHPEERRRLLEALFRTQISFMARFPHIRLKIFLRTDIWTTLNFTNKSHIADKMIQLRWSKERLLQLIIKRLVGSTEVRAHCESKVPELRGVQETEGLPMNSQENIFYSVFEKQVYSGANEAALFEWMIARITDGLGSQYPRELISFANLARDAQLALGPPAGTAPISGKAVLRAFGEVSGQRVTTYLSEFPEIQNHVKMFKGRTSAVFSRRELNEMFARFQPNGDEAIERLHDVGLLIPKSGHLSTSEDFEVPRLYRIGLGLVIPGRP